MHLNRPADAPAHGAAPGDPRSGTAPRLLVLAALAAGLTALVVQGSVRFGRLTLTPKYDDVSYMANGAWWLELFRDEGVLGVARQYVADPPRAPYSTGISALGFAVFGYHDWAPYAASAVLVFLFLAFADALFKDARPWQRLAGAVLMACVPFTLLAAHEIRPDAAAALWAAVGVVLALTGPLTGVGWRRPFLVGAAFGIALVCKPSVFAATTIVFGATVALATAADAMLRRAAPAPAAALKAWGACLGGLVLLAALYPAPSWVWQWSYFYQNIFGDTARYWANQGGMGDQVRYFLTGPGGSKMLGRMLYLLIAIIAAGAAWAVACRRRSELVRGSALLGALAVAFTVPTAARMKNEFTGLTFQILLAATALLALSRMLAAERERPARLPSASLALVASVLVGVLLFRMPFRWGDFNSSLAIEHRAVVRNVYEAVRASLGPQGGEVLLTSTGAVNVDVMNYYALRDNAPLNFGRRGGPWIDSIERWKPLIERADAIIATEEGIGPPLVFERYGEADPLPYAELQDEVIEAIEARGDFERVAAFPAGPCGRHYFVYRRIAGFEGFEDIEGLKPAEGPYPQWGLPTVRWGQVPGTKVRVRCTNPAEARLVAAIRTQAEGQQVSVLVDGAEVESLAAPLRSWTTIHVRFPLEPGEHVIELAYTAAQKGTDRHAVLFRSLTVTQKPR